MTTGRLPMPAIEAASSGFLTLSTLCSPNDLPSLFHPGSVFEILPSRFAPPNDKPVRSLERRSPPGVRFVIKSRTLSFRV